MCCLIVCFVVSSCSTSEEETTKTGCAAAPKGASRKRANSTTGVTLATSPAYASSSSPTYLQPVSSFSFGGQSYQQLQTASASTASSATPRFPSARGSGLGHVDDDDDDMLNGGDDDDAGSAGSISDSKGCWFHFYSRNGCTRYFKCPFSHHPNDKPPRIRDWCRFEQSFTGCTRQECNFSHRNPGAGGSVTTFQSKFEPIQFVAVPMLT